MERKKNIGRVCMCLLHISSLPDSGWGQTSRWRGVGFHKINNPFFFFRRKRLTRHVHTQIEKKREKEKCEQVRVPFVVFFFLPPLRSHQHHRVPSAILRAWVCARALWSVLRRRACLCQLGFGDGPAGKKRRKRKDCSISSEIFLLLAISERLYLPHFEKPSRMNGWMDRIGLGQGSKFQWDEVRSFHAGTSTWRGKASLFSLALLKTEVANTETRREGEELGERKLEK